MMNTEHLDFTIDLNICAFYQSKDLLHLMPKRWSVKWLHIQGPKRKKPLEDLHQSTLKNRGSR